MPPNRGSYTPSPDVLAVLPPDSGNALNGLGERDFRPASPMFWHPPDKHPFGAAAAFAGASVRATPEAREAFAAAYDYPPLEPIGATRAEGDPTLWHARARAFALAHEADLFGAVAMAPAYVFEGYAVSEPNVIVLGFAHDYERIRQLPSTPENGVGAAEVGRQYARGARASYALANWIRRQGFQARPYPGPRADALLLIPAAIAAGLGELGKHGSIINRTHGASFRLAAVTTDLPLTQDVPDAFGADGFCLNCRVCADACPPEAIIAEKQWVRGEHRWYVDFDRCIPYFAENAACGICIAVCPWSRPGIADRLVEKLARRRARGSAPVGGAIAGPARSPG